VKCRTALGFVMVLGGASAAAQPAVEAERLERELSTVEAELDRVESANRVVPELFSVGDRDERACFDGALRGCGAEAW
jgi:hypothetical protein